MTHELVEYAAEDGSDAVPLHLVQAGGLDEVDWLSWYAFPRHGRLPEHIAPQTPLVADVFAEEVGVQRLVDDGLQVMGGAKVGAGAEEEKEVCLEDATA